MSLSNKLGSSFADVSDKIKIKTIHIKTDETEFDLKIRVPLKAEIEQINLDIMTPNKEKADAFFAKYKATVDTSIQEGGEDFLKIMNENKNYIQIKDDDILIEGTSLKSYANMSAIMEQRVERYFKLIISDTSEPINETYEQIIAELPEEIVKKIVEEIEKAIRPDYNSVKKN